MAPAMLAGYLFIILAASLWGTSAVVAKKLMNTGLTDPLLISQVRALFAWLALAVTLALVRPRLLAVRPADLWRFLLLGIIGICGSSFLLYFAMRGMDTAVADLIQFTAPAMVVVWMWLRGREPLDRPKMVALTLSIAGSGLALGAFGRSWHTAPVYAVSAFASALGFAFLLVWGKGLSSRYPMPTYLHYSLLAATLFWLVAAPSDKLPAVLTDPRQFAIYAGFGVMSMAAPYALLFLGLKRLPASRAGIASTFEPVFITLAAAFYLGEHLTLSQLAGVALVLAAIVILELRPPPSRGVQA